LTAIPIGPPNALISDARTFRVLRSSLFSIPCALDIPALSPLVLADIITFSFTILAIIF
jgi:hypothetical protein